MGQRAQKTGIGLILVWTFIIILIASPAVLAAQKETSAIRFTDLAASDQELSYVNYLSNKGIITGHPDGTFKPLEALTRAQAAVVMVKAGQLQTDSQAPSPFKDLNAEHWARPYVAAAVKAGYISGFPDGTFRPEENLTRAEAITLIMRLSKQALSAPLPALSDMDAQHWAARPVGTGLACGMVGLSADGTQFLPDEAFSRINLVHALGILFSIDPELYASSLPGKIKIIQGNVKVIKSGSQQEELLKGERIVDPGDRIISEKGGSAELSYADGSSLLIKEDTNLSIKEAQGRKYIKTNGQEGIAVDWLNIDLKQGTVLAALATKHENTEATDTLKTGETKISSLYHSKLIASLDGRRYMAAAKVAANTTPWYQASKDKKVKVKVDMPWGVAAIRGTFALISVAPNGQASVSCLTGSAEVTNGGQTVPLGQNQSTGINEPGAPPPPPAPMPPTALQQFAQEQNWIQQTAQNMDQNREQAPPPPPLPGPPVVSLQTPRPTAPGSALQEVNRAMQNSGITGPGSQGNQPPASSSSPGHGSGGNTSISLTAVTITGNTVVGATLTANLGGATATYQWKRANGAAGTYASIDGATSSTYTLTAEDVGKFIVVAATGTGHYTGTVTSVATAAVAPAIEATPIANATSNPMTVIRLTGDTFSEGATYAENWTFNYGTTGITAPSSIEMHAENAGAVTIDFTGISAPGTLTIQAKAAALTGGVASNELSVTVIAITSTTVSKSPATQLTKVGDTLTLELVMSDGQAAGSRVEYFVAVQETAESTSAIGSIHIENVNAFQIPATYWDDNTDSEQSLLGKYIDFGAQLVGEPNSGVAQDRVGPVVQGQWYQIGITETEFLEDENIWRITGQTTPGTIVKVFLQETDAGEILPTSGDTFAYTYDAETAMSELRFVSYWQDDFRLGETICALYNEAIIGSSISVEAIHEESQQVKGYTEPYGDVMLTRNWNEEPIGATADSEGYFEFSLALAFSEGESVLVETNNDSAARSALQIPVLSQ